MKTFASFFRFPLDYFCLFVYTTFVYIIIADRLFSFLIGMRRVCDTPLYINIFIGGTKL